MNYEITVSETLSFSDSATITHNVGSETTFLDAINQFLAFVFNLSIA